MIETKENYTFEELEEIIAELRSDHGCPWDRAQTHESMKKCLQDECDEVLEAIDHQDMDNLCEELGDVLLQVMLHSQIAKEEGDFTIQDVISMLCRKMIRRHPMCSAGRNIKRRKKAKRAGMRLKKWKKKPGKKASDCRQAGQER